MIQDETAPSPTFSLLDLTHKGHLGPAIVSNLDLQEGQVVTFVLRTVPPVDGSPALDPPMNSVSFLYPG